MRTRSKLILAGLTASLLLGFAVSSAGARFLSTSNRNFRVTWASLRFFDEEGLAEIRCPLTLEGSFHSTTINKVGRALVGSVSRAIAKNDSCTGGRTTIVQGTLPWHLTYEVFAGTLPNITSIDVLLSRYAFFFESTIVFIRVICLYSDHGNPEENLMARVTRNIATSDITTVAMETNRRAGFTAGSGVCPPFGRIEGAGQMFLLGNTTRIRLTLI